MTGNGRKEPNYAQKNTTMISFGKKIISAFLEVDEQKEPPAPPENRAQPDDPVRPQDRAGDRFTGHFDKLLSDANIPGPDYYEFARMIAVMQAIPDEAARYNAAFAGLRVQGLDKQRLLDTAGEYLRILTTDAAQFQATVDAKYQEKVHGPETEAAEKADRIRALSQEIVQLQQQISSLQAEIGISKDKLSGSSSAYTAESDRRQQEIRRDIDKINQYIH
jgi:hypothetical protein